MEEFTLQELFYKLEKKNKFNAIWWLSVIVICCSYVIICILIYKIKY